MVGYDIIAGLVMVLYVIVCCWLRHYCRCGFVGYCCVVVGYSVVTMAHCSVLLVPALLLVWCG